ncbi:low molecular weight phosphotyrosine protein phosphatase [Lachnoclostridium pacaense]|uniref:low molecular weight protein-tyrosine-phosphatase n=1 Tax=Enterocloster hominis (ex Hitch et al. 2024) TaxID=1917870 RepID=UPI001D127787|nr:low molecular weight protein-tyrosine-phosphatase [Lachnoclostridium pacaense]MCC2819466.1 low molecular weight phosphotyrosine protein phosphatase [Lachnoclostridium pacaense]
MIKILFICHGNICRSPMALYYFQDLVHKKGLEDMFFLDSAATSTEEIGNSAHRGTREKLRQAGISCQGHQAKQMKPRDYGTFDYLIGMDDWNIRNMTRITGGDPDNKIHKLLEFAGSSRDVADPWYTGDFETTWNDITTGCNALLEKILRSPNQWK